MDDEEFITEREAWLMSGRPPCMKCGSGVVHLIALTDDDAKWQCCKCFNTFYHEPSKLNAFECRKCHPKLCHCAERKNDN